MGRRLLTTLLAAVLAASAAPAAPAAGLMRLELHLSPTARTEPQVLLMTLGGPIYCMQLEALARNVAASLAAAARAGRWTGATRRT